MKFDIEDIEGICLSKSSTFDQVCAKNDFIQNFIRDRFIRPVKTELSEIEKTVIQYFNDINLIPLYAPTNERELIIIIKNAIPYIGNNGNFNWIDVSHLTSLAGVFKGMKDFNGDITTWDVSNVQNMSYTFYEAKAFKRDLSLWNPKSIKYMTGMFQKTEYPYKDLIKGWIKKYKVSLALGAI